MAYKQLIGPRGDRPEAKNRGIFISGGASKRYNMNIVCNTRDLTWYNTVSSSQIRVPPQQSNLCVLYNVFLKFDIYDRVVLDYKLQIIYTPFSSPLTSVHRQLMTANNLIKEGG